ncbi:hypothetical protein B0A55_00729 [Friedmanniomyces simplex]|uniref:Glutamine amidotransferase domain-containing protein n=1 Tax=Friedmanniomyces simplex TaxID=329884 RepID=A0A4U0Y6A1_9PEZI|nr:hypothetical protein B0A55_00729 [Friedmanniomyces simplex]
MKPPFRIAILECDEPIGRTKAKYGGYGNVFKALLDAGADHLAQQDGVSRPALELKYYNVVNAQLYPKLEDIDAVLLTGSRHNAFDPDPWILALVDFTKKVLAQHRVRVIGVCFGHQIVGRAMDVKVDRSDRGWEVSVTPVRLTGKGSELFGVEELAIHQMHHDIVTTHPSSVAPLGHTDRCDVQGMYIRAHLITVQGHPEFTGEIVEELLENRHKRGIFSDPVFEDGMSRVRKPHDGVVVGAAFLRFLMEG